jgi:hypothetical protein
MATTEKDTINSKHLLNRLPATNYSTRLLSALKEGKKLSTRAVPEEGNWVNIDTRERV